MELSPCTHSVIHRHLFSDMEPKGDAPVTSPNKSEVSTPHILEGEEFSFPPEGFPFSEGIPSSLPSNYVSLAQWVSGTPSASSLYHNTVWALGTMATSSLFITNKTSR